METQKSSQMQTTRTGRTVRAAASQPPREVGDAIAFLYSMIDLIEARGWDHVDEQFVSTMMGMATRILVPWDCPVSPEKTIANVRSAIDAASGFLEELGGRVPTPILKGAVTMIETTARAARGEQVETATRASSHQRKPGGLS